ncbi:MAG TPA: RNA polymerase sigma factor [Vicinamibacteria bacterium]|nr:RNA polymerase sigma factor [Vicinamibacteria bacterium]
MGEDRSAHLADLLRKARKGDDDALNSLCRELEPPIQRFFWQKFHDPDLVDELCQETFMRFLKNFPNIRDRMSLRGFVIKIAIHVTQDYFRKKYRQREEALEPNLLRQKGDPAGALQHRMDLRKALAKLPERSRRILLMRADGYNYEEISAKTQLSVSGVKMQVKRNLERLRSTLTDVTLSSLVTTIVTKGLIELSRNGLG